MLGEGFTFSYQKAMLYERWRQVAQARASETALNEFPSGRRWTFAELAAAVETLPASQNPFVFTQGHNAEFVFDVLRAWRDKSVLCPLETGQSRLILPVPEKNISHIKLTSATTESARAVAFTANQLSADADNIVATMGLRPEWPNLGVISLAHSYGFSNLVLPLLLHGIPLVIAASPLPEIIRAAARTLPLLTLAAVPALWRTWHETNAIPTQTMLAISAGAPLSAGLERDVFQGRGLKIHNFYGSTECGGIAYDSSAAPRTEDACVGRPMQNVTLDCNNSGCLRVASRAVGESYWPESAAALGHGIFQTSDLCEFRDGQVFLWGRLNDQINIAGRKVSPATIERALAAHPAVRESVVFGMPERDSERGETIIAMVVLRQAASGDDLKNFLLLHLPAWQVPRVWRFVNSLGENQRGKISRTAWRQKYLEQK